MKVESVRDQDDVEKLLADLRRHQADLVAARGTASSSALQALIDQTPRMVRRYLMAKAKREAMEYAQAVAQIEAVFHRLLVLNRLLERACGVECSLLTADAVKLYIPSFNVPRTDRGRWQEPLVTYTGIVSGEPFIRSVDAETQKLRSVCEISLTPRAPGGKRDG